MQLNRQHTLAERRLFILLATIKEYASTKGGAVVMDVNKTFSSPSTAASFCFGNSNNGWTNWKDKEGQTLDAVYRKLLELEKTDGTGLSTKCGSSSNFDKIHV